MKILKIVVLQLFWFLAVSTNQKYQVPLFLLSIIIAIANFKIYKPQISRGHYIFTTVLFVLYGMTQELSFEKFGLVKYNQSSFPLWLTSLYVVFIAYYGDIFNYLYKLPKALVFIIGAVGGIAAYYGGVKISPIEVQSSLYYVFVGLGWGAFLVFSFKIFYEGFLWNKLLDSSILYSFDKSGFLRHQKDFNQNDELKFKEG
ncbi:DUF2878 family protein, partial [Bacteriovoracaceae bacterium]|nr:DUF2878 family protein [Bacteriovoracaceae bacterium]